VSVAVAADTGWRPAQTALYLVCALTIANAVSYVDRQALVLLVDPVKAHLGVGDTQIGLLQGPAFALFYAFLGVFLGRLADRTHRIRLLIVGLVFWSTMTVACGFANDFWTMFAFRTGVGVGEAVLTPAAASLIADRVDAGQRARAMSAFVGGQSLGGGLALIGGGALVASIAALAGPDGMLYGLAPWQWVFVACGLLAIPLLTLLLPIREPARTGRVRDAAPAAAAGRGTARAARGEAGSAAALARARDWAQLRPRIPVLAGLIGAFCLLGVVGWGAGSWLPTFFMRRHGLSVATVGAVYGAILLVLAPTGAVAGGALTDWLRSRGRADAAVLVGLLGVFGLCGAVFVTSRMPTPTLAWFAVACYAFFSPFPFGTVYAAIAEAAPDAYRGQAVAVYALGLNVFGFGLGPTTVGWANDHLYTGPAGIGDSLALLATVYGVLAAAAFLAVRRRHARLVASLRPERAA
jgi:MFS family permease